MYFFVGLAQHYMDETFFVRTAKWLKMMEKKFVELTQSAVLLQDIRFEIIIIQPKRFE